MKLAGNRTYIISVLIVAYAVIGVILGKTDVNTAVLEVLGGLGLGFLRKGIENK